MRHIGTLLSVLTLYLAAYNATQMSDRNDQWRKNNMLMKNIDNFYKMLPLSTADANVRTKRFIGVLSSALVYYSASNSPDRLDRVREAVNRTKSQLNKTADVLGGPMRSYLSNLRVVIDQPINDIKASCKPDTSQKDCTAALRELHRKDQEMCSEYDRNLRLYGKSRDFFTSSRYLEFIRTVKEISDNGDKVALSFFVDMVMIEFTDLVRNGRSLYRMTENTTYPCNFANLPLY